MRMLWYSGLYTGKKADLHRADVIRQIRDGKSLPWVYVVTPASNRENILDIYRADDLKNPAYRGREFLILGVADGYQEALEVATGIVGELYEKTGDFHLERLIPEVEACWS